MTAPIDWNDEPEQADPQPVPPGFHEQLRATKSVEPAEPVILDEQQPARHTVDTITGSDLDQLYARIHYLTGYTATLETYAAEQRTIVEQTQDLLRIANATSNTSEAERAHAVQRAEKAEAANTRVRKLANDWAILRTHGSAAYELRAALDEPKEPRP